MLSEIIEQATQSLKTCYSVDSGTLAHHEMKATWLLPYVGHAFLCLPHGISRYQIETLLTYNALYGYSTWVCWSVR